MAQIDLYNDDCLNILPSLQTQPDRYVIVSDPPFNIGYHYKGYQDKLSTQQYAEFMRKVFFNGLRSVIIHYPEALYELAVQNQRIPDRVISWCYNSNTKRQHRDIAFFGIVPDFSKVKQPYKNQNDKRIQKLIEQGHTGCNLYDWWEVNQVKNVSKEKTAHPCQMPLEVMKRVVGILPEGITVIDPFMGSGTTGVACKELGVPFIGIELIPEYFEIAKRRIKESERDHPADYKAV